jgi:hypothetical protein
MVGWKVARTVHMTAEMMAALTERNLAALKVSLMVEMTDSSWVEMLALMTAALKAVLKGVHSVLYLVDEMGRRWVGHSV